MFDRSTEISLNYKDHGEGMPVLLIHGVGSDLESWDGVIDNLSDQRRYIRFDLRGHGQSKRTPGPYSLSGFAEDAIALLDYLSVKRAAVVGFSLGGLIAQAIALNYPQRLSCVSLISTVAGRTEKEQARVNQRAAILASEGANKHLATAVDRWFTPEFVAKHPEVLEARRQKSLNNDPDSYVSAYRVLAGNDLGEQLHSIKIPTLIMTGENDVGSSPRMSTFIHKQIAGSELHILPRLKHSILLEAPDQVAGILEPFLAQHTNCNQRSTK